MPGIRIGVDVGGTFTDLCLFDEQTGTVGVVKVPSTPDDPSQGILAGLQAILAQHHAQPADVAYFAHGTTVATNTLLQHNGARSGLLTLTTRQDFAIC